MKTMRKVFALIMALSMVMALVVTANAAGNGTITITNAAKGETYKIYKLFDATYAKNAEGDVVTDTNGKPITAYYGTIPTGEFSLTEGEGDEATTVKYKLTDYFEYYKTSENDKAGNYIQLRNGVNEADLFKALKAWANKQGSPSGSQVANGSALTFSELDYGYYVITSTLGTGASITVDSANPSADVIDKNPTTPINDLKKETSEDQKSVKIGDTVNYTVSFGTANYSTDENGNSTAITKYTIEDNFAGGSLTNITVTSITIGGDDYKIDGKTPQFDNGKIEITWATPNVDNDGTITSYNSLYASGAVIEISYSATVSAADENGEIKNTVTVTTDAGDTGTKTNIVKTYKIDLQKYKDSINEANKLDGAEFELYGSKDGNDKIAVTAVYKTGSTTEIDYYRPVLEGETAMVIKAGTATIKGLDGDVSYYLEETKAPDGYNKLTSRQEVKMYTENKSDETDDAATVKISADQTANVVNNAGAELPSTGGIGTTIFTVVGATLMVGAAVLFVTKKRSAI